MTLPNVLKLAGSGVAEVIGLAFDVSDNATLGGGDDTLHSYVIPANTLSRDGDSIEFEYLGTVAAGTHNTLELRLADQIPVAIVADLLTAAGGWSLKGRITRTGTANARATFTFASTASATGVVLGFIDVNDMSVDWSSGADLHIIGTTDDPAEITLCSVFIAFWAAALST